MEKKNEFCLQEIKGEKGSNLYRDTYRGRANPNHFIGISGNSGEHDGRKDALYDAGTGLDEKSNLF